MLFRPSGRRAAVLILPAAAFWLLCFAIPLVYVLWLSFYNTNFITTKYVGVSNYIAAFTDRDFQRTFYTALCYTVMIIPASVFLSYKISLSLATLDRRRMMLFQAIYYLPTLTSGLIISFVWKWIFGRLGLLEVASTLLGLPVIEWLAHEWPAKIATSFAYIFSSIGGNCIWLCAVLLSIPVELYDQARIDGASLRQIRRHITLPYMALTLGLLAFLQAMGTLQYWEMIYSLTSGGPYKSTATTVYDIYTTAFLYSRFGLAAAKTIILIIIIGSMVAIRKVLEKREQ